MHGMKQDLCLDEYLYEKTYDQQDDPPLKEARV